MSRGLSWRQREVLDFAIQVMARTGREFVHLTELRAEFRREHDYPRPYKFWPAWRASVSRSIKLMERAGLLSRIGVGQTTAIQLTGLGAGVALLNPISVNVAHFATKVFEKEEGNESGSIDRETTESRDPQ